MQKLSVEEAVGYTPSMITPMKGAMGYENETLYSLLGTHGNNIAGMNDESFI